MYLRSRETCRCPLQRDTKNPSMKWGCKNCSVRRTAKGSSGCWADIVPWCHCRVAINRPLASHSGGMFSKMPWFMNTSVCKQFSFQKHLTKFYFQFLTPHQAFPTQTQAQPACLKIIPQRSWTKVPLCSFSWARFCPRESSVTCRETKGPTNGLL